MLAFYIVIFLLWWPSSEAVASERQSASIAGRWQIEFGLLNDNHRIQFEALPSGEGRFLVLNRAQGGTTPPNPTRATWSFKGQTQAIYFFAISGDIELGTRDGGVEPGKLELYASSDLNVPIKALSGWGVFHPAKGSSSTRGGEDPMFNFVATRADGPTVQVVAPSPGQKLRRGKETRIEWEVESSSPIASQSLLLSTDGGEVFFLIAPLLDAGVRSFDWIIPDDFPKSKKVVIKVVSSDLNGMSAEGTSRGVIRIK